MDVEPNKFIDLFKNPAFLLLAAWIFREIWSISKKKTSELQLTLKETSDKINQLTIAIVKLETRLEVFQKVFEVIPQLEKDVSAAHDKLRELGHA